jgi:MFS family permease
MCDRFGRRRMMIASMIAQAILTAGYALATAYSEFLLLYTVAGIAGALYDPAFAAMIADLVPPERREEVYGLSYMIANIGTMAGPIIGGVVATTRGYAILYVCAAISAAATATGLILLTRESHPEDVMNVSLSRFTGIFKDRVFMLFCFMGAMTNVVYAQLYGLLSVYTKHVGFDPYVFGLLFAANGTMVVTLQIPIRKGTTRIGPAKAFIIAQLLYAAGFTYFMFATSFYEFLAGIVVLTLGEITFVPASSGFVANLAPANMRGRYMAMLGLFFGIGGSAGSQIAFSIFGILADKRLVWGILGSIGFATLLGYAFLLRMSHKEKTC